MKRLLATAIGLALGSVAAQAQPPVPTDARFAVKASIGNTFEIDESRLALRRSEDPGVRAFARWMIDDHSAALRALQAAGRPTAADTAPALDPEHEAMVTKLGTLEGRAFDEAYLADQYAAHRETAQALRDFIQTGHDPSLVRWAERTLPTVEMHLMHVRPMTPRS